MTGTARTYVQADDVVAPRVAIVPAEHVQHVTDDYSVVEVSGDGRRAAGRHTGPHTQLCDDQTAHAEHNHGAAAGRRRAQKAYQSRTCANHRVPPGHPSHRTRTGSGRRQARCCARCDGWGLRLSPPPTPTSSPLQHHSTQGFNSAASARVRTTRKALKQPHNSSCNCRLLSHSCQFMRSPARYHPSHHRMTLQSRKRCIGACSCGASTRARTRVEGQYCIHALLLVVAAKQVQRRAHSVERVTFA